MQTPYDRSDMSTVEHDLTRHLRVIRRALLANKKAELSLCAVETFVSIALTLMRRSEPSEVRDAARTVEIKARLDGIEVVRGAA